MIRPREITLALIAKLALVKSVQTSNSFRLKNHFSRKKNDKTSRTHPNR